jgi:hypothetical protein
MEHGDPAAIIKAATEECNISEQHYVGRGLLNYHKKLSTVWIEKDRLCGLVVRVLAYRSGGPGSIPGTTRKKSSESGTGSTQPREYN